jgi:hypothetical protein
MPRHLRREPRRAWTTGAVVVGLVLSAALVWRSSNAAFVDTTANTGNTWNTGTVVLDDTVFAASLPFAPVNLQPGDFGGGCAEVRYTGSLNAEVRLHAANYANPGGDLGTAIELYIEVQPGQVCNGFDHGEGTAIFGDWDHALADNDSLADFGARTGFATGLPAAGAWQPVGGGAADYQSYLISYWVLDDNNAQGESASVDFVWEAQNL